MKKLIIIGILSIATTLGAGAAINTSYAIKGDTSQTSPSSSKTIEVTTKKELTHKKNKKFIITLKDDTQEKQVCTIVVLADSKKLNVNICGNSTIRILKFPFYNEKYVQILQDLINKAEASDVKENPSKYLNEAFEKLDNPKETTPSSADHKGPVPTEPTNSTSSTEPTTQKVVQLKLNKSGQIDIYLFDKDPDNDDDYDETSADKICTLSFTDTEQKQCTVTFKDGTTKTLTLTSTFNPYTFRHELQKLIDESKTADRNINEYIIKALTPNSSTTSTDEGKIRMIMLPTPGSSEENLQPKIPQMPSFNDSSIHRTLQVSSSQNQIIFDTKISDTTIQCSFDEKNPNFPMKLIIYNDNAPCIKWCTNFNNMHPKALIDALFPYIQKDLKVVNPTLAYDIIMFYLIDFIYQYPYFQTKELTGSAGDAVFRCEYNTDWPFKLHLEHTTNPRTRISVDLSTRILNPLAFEMNNAIKANASAFNAAIPVLEKYAPFLDILRPPYTFRKTIGDTTIQCNPSKDPQFPWELTIDSSILKQYWIVYFNGNACDLLYCLTKYLERETLPQDLTKFDIAIWYTKQMLGIKE